MPAGYRDVLRAAGLDGLGPGSVVASLVGLGRDGDTRDLAAIERRLGTVHLQYGLAEGIPGTGDVSTAI